MTGESLPGALRWFPLVLDVPIVRLLGVEPEDPRDPTKGISFAVTDATLNAAAVLHGGAIATALDLAAYLRVLPELGTDEQAVTHSFSATYLTASRRGDRLAVTASLLRRSRRVAFLSATAMVEDRPVATATVVKSIIRA